MKCRNRCNLAPPDPPTPTPKLLEAEERRHFLGMIALWRLFDLYLMRSWEMS
ncbi:MAG: hypothetical protein LUQ59_04370 [Methanothrix sp.]|nr:hypothetical protein [Methanothrix sp.]